MNKQKLGVGNSETKFPGPCIIYSFGVDHSTLVNIAQLHNYNLLMNNLTFNFRSVLNKLVSLSINPDMHLS